MKNFLLILFCVITIINTVQSQYVDIIDEELREAIFDTGIDVTGDGKINLNEAKSLTTLIVQLDSITNFSGMEHFVNIRKFFLTSNYFDGLNLDIFPELNQLRLEGATQDFEYSDENNKIDKYCYINILAANSVDIKNSKIDYLAVKGIKNSISIENIQYLGDIGFYHSILVEAGSYDRLKIKDIDYKLSLKVQGFFNNALDSIFIENAPIEGISYKAKYSDFKNLTNLVTTYVSHPDSVLIKIFNCPNLNTLSITSPKSSKFVIDELPNLEEIILENGDFEDLTFQKFPNIKDLTLKDFIVDQLIFDKGLQLDSLKSIELENLEAENLIIKNLEYLGHINLLNTTIKNFKIYDLPELTYLRTLENFGNSKIFVKNLPKLNYFGHSDSQMMSNVEKLELLNINVLNTFLVGKFIDTLIVEKIDFNYPLTLNINGLVTIKEIESCETMNISAEELYVDNCPKLLKADFSDLTILELKNCNALKDLKFTDADLGKLDLNSMNELKVLSLDQVSLDTLYLTNLEKLEEIEIVDQASSKLISISDCGNFHKLLGNIEIEELDLSNLPLIESLEDFTVNKLVLDELPIIKSINLKGIEDFEITNTPLLTNFSLRNGQAPLLDFNDIPSLINLSVMDNGVDSLIIDQCTLLEVLNIEGNTIRNLNYSSLQNLKHFTYSDNDLIGVFSLAPMDSLRYLDISKNTLDSIHIEGHKVLDSINVGQKSGSLVSLYLNNLPQLSNIDFNQLFNYFGLLRLNNLPSLERIRYLGIKLENVLMSDIPNLRSVTFFTSHNFGNDVKYIDFRSFPKLEGLNLEGTSLDSIKIPTENLRFLNIKATNIKELDLSSCKKLYAVNTEKCPLSTLDLSSCDSLVSLRFNGSELDYLNINNGNITQDIYGLVYERSKPPLIVCIDPGEKIKFPYSDSPNFSFSWFCHSTLTEYNLESKFYYSEDKSCNITTLDPINFSNLYYDFYFDDIQTTIYLSNNPPYKIEIPEMEFSISPGILYHEDYNFTPNTFSVNPDTITDHIVVDFCIVSDTIIHDVGVNILPLTIMQAGFPYELDFIVFNYGSITEDITIELYWDTTALTVMDKLEWELTGNKFSKSFQIEPFNSLNPLPPLFRVNSPTSDNPINSGDKIDFTVSVNIDEIERDYSNNKSYACFTVRNSYDPNDKTCVQGKVLNDTLLGEYLDYMIRFENNGDAEARNVRITDLIDTSVFDLQTIKIIQSSHPCVLQLHGNLAEFQFAGINLPYQDSINQGYVIYAIRTKTNAKVGDLIKNTADIYFDYNFPITTNTTITEVVTDMDGDGFHNLEDCDDLNNNINPGIIEIPYNEIDDDCNPNTLDDDLDQDGYSLINDCDDTNAFVNPEMEELVYNGLDDDCNPLTLDDDLDQDGFDHILDCNDEDPNINPDAIEIPGNGIDENCDGEDVIVNNDIYSLNFKFRPNPGMGLFTFNSDFRITRIEVFSSNGMKVYSISNSSHIDITKLKAGIYIAKVYLNETIQCVKIVKL